MNHLIQNYCLNTGNVAMNEAIDIELTMHHFAQTIFYIPIKKNTGHQ